MVGPEHTIGKGKVWADAQTSLGRSRFPEHIDLPAITPAHMRPHQVHHGAAVQDVAFVPPKAAAAAAAVADDTASADAGGTGGEGPASKVLVAVRGSTSLFVLDADAGNVRTLGLRRCTRWLAAGPE